MPDHDQVEINAVSDEEFIKQVEECVAEMIELGQLSYSKDGKVEVLTFETIMSECLHDNEDLLPAMLWWFKAVKVQRKGISGYVDAIDLGTKYAAEIERTITTYIIEVVLDVNIRV